MHTLRLTNHPPPPADPRRSLCGVVKKKEPRFQSLRRKSREPFLLLPPFLHHHHTIIIIPTTILDSKRFCVPVPTKALTSLQISLQSLRPPGFDSRFSIQAYTIDPFMDPSIDRNVGRQCLIPTASQPRVLTYRTLVILTIACLGWYSLWHGLCSTREI